ncbi:MAG: transcription elongation factor GreA [Phototrophicales bacterium]|nr:MAG: transcription elongation factor GreA [Phototrophicales bacterium]
MTNRVHYLTQEGYNELERKLHRLRTERRQEIAERLRLVMSEGGELSENAEYEAAKADQAFLESEIQRLEEILSNAEIIENTGPKDTIGIGDRVTLQEVGASEPEVYFLVGPAEANPRVGKISHESPLGQALIGKRVGDKVRVHAPDGDIEFEILAIE